MNRHVDPRGVAAFIPRMTARLLLLIGATPIAFSAAVPERHPETRYAKLRAESPFAVATAEAPKEEEKIPWAQNLYVGSVAKFKQNSEEKDWVILKDRTQPGTLIQLFGSDVNAEGYQLVKLEWSEDPKKTKASVKKGTEFATIEMDQAAFTAPVAVPQPAQRPQAQVAKQPGVPGGIPVPAGGIRPPAATINRPATPAVRPPVTIPRPTNLPPAITPQQPNPGVGPAGANPSGTNTRQRIRVIPSPNQ